MADYTKETLEQMDIAQLTDVADEFRLYEDMSEVEKRFVADYDRGSAAIERGSFYNGFKGRSFRLILLY